MMPYLARVGLTSIADVTQHFFSTVKGFWMFTDSNLSVSSQIRDVVWGAKSCRCQWIPAKSGMTAYPRSRYSQQIGLYWYSLDDNGMPNRSRLHKRSQCESASFPSIAALRVASPDKALSSRCVSALGFSENSSVRNRAD